MTISINRGRSDSRAGLLAKLVEYVESELAAGKYDSAALILEENALPAWFGFDRGQIGAVLAELSREISSMPPVLRVMYDFLRESGTRAYSPIDVPRLLNADTQAAALLSLSFQLFDWRLRGMVQEAYGLLASIRGELAKQRNIHSQHGIWNTFYLMEYGTTAMLTGHFRDALSFFTEAQMMPLYPLMPFLTRDAYVKSALIHATFGDLEVSANLLAQSEAIVRTDSWVEESIDASVALVRILLVKHQPDEAALAIDTVPRHELGEMWPFYALTLFQVLSGAGRGAEAASRIEALGTFALPKRPGNGLPGSIVCVLLAINALQRGQPRQAREMLDHADPTLISTRLVSAMYELSIGQARSALSIGHQLAGDTDVLRQFELWRLSVLSASYLQLDDEPSCIEVLQRAADAPRGMDVSEALKFSDRVRELAASAVPNWPDDANVHSDRLDFLANAVEELSERELEILGALSTGASREQIAGQFFVTLNTVKTQLSSIYRKLGVTSRLMAVKEADRRGLILRDVS